MSVASIPELTIKGLDMKKRGMMFLFILQEASPNA